MPLTWLVSQAVKTPLFHGGSEGSTPSRVTICTIIINDPNGRKYILEYNDRLELFNSCINLAMSVAIKHWSYQYVEQEDMQQEALLALWRATERYDENKGAFTTYATHYIRCSLNTVGNKYRYGHIGVTEPFKQALHIIKECDENDRPIEAILAEHEHTPAVKDYVKFLYHNNHHFDSLNRCLNDDTDVTLCDTIASAEDIEHTVLSALNYKTLLELVLTDFRQQYESKMKGVRDRNRQDHLFDCFVRQLFESRTNASIADEVGVSREAVRTQFNRWYKQLRELITTKYLAPKTKTSWSYNEE